MKIGIYGGSFNPVHNAHIALAEYFSEFYGLDKVLFVPAYRSPFKERSFDTASDIQRLEMLKIAISGFDNFEVETFEIERPEISYTIDTFRYLKSQYPDNTDFFLLIGADQSVEFHNWKNWQEIIKQTQICIAGRNDLNNFFDYSVKAFCTKNNLNINYLNSPILNISSESIREKIKEGENIDDLVPELVKSYIFQNNLYK